MGSAPSLVPTHTSERKNNYQKGLKITASNTSGVYQRISAQVLCGVK